MSIAIVVIAAYTAILAVALPLVLRGSADAVADDFARRTGGVSVRPVGATIVFDVQVGAAADLVAEALAEAGVIADAERFRLLLAYTGVGAELQAGRYEFEPNTPAAEVIRRMRAGLTADALVPVPEGLRLEEVAAILVDSGIVEWAEWGEALARPRFRTFLSTRPEGASLLGYLLPASYPLRREMTADEVIEVMLDAFEAALTNDVALIEDVRASGMTLHEVVTLASIVERESLIREEQSIIASVFLNRLEDGIPLQADPTVQFAIMAREQDGPITWWKIELTLDDLAFDSLYNTYAYGGLPPGPIANPGIDAIRAVVRPAETDFYYFVATGDGSHAFAETLDEHNANVERYSTP